jgi:hypothetical protein
LGSVRRRLHAEIAPVTGQITGQTLNWAISGPWFANEPSRWLSSLAEAKLTVLVVFSSMIGRQRSNSLDCPRSGPSKPVRSKPIVLQVFSISYDQLGSCCRRRRPQPSPSPARLLTSGMLECRKERTDAAHSGAQPGPRRDEIDAWSLWVGAKPLDI